MVVPNTGTGDTETGSDEVCVGLRSDSRVIYDM